MKKGRLWTTNGFSQAQFVANYKSWQRRSEYHNEYLNENEGKDYIDNAISSVEHLKSYKTEQAGKGGKKSHEVILITESS